MTVQMVYEEKRLGPTRRSWSIHGSFCDGPSKSVIKGLLFSGPFVCCLYVTVFMTVLVNVTRNPSWINRFLVVIRACGHDLLLRCQMLLEVLAILRAPWLRLCYVSVVSIIFYCSMPILFNFHILLATFYIIFGTNILIQCLLPVPVCCMFYVSQNIHIKRNLNGIKTDGAYFWNIWKI